MDAPLLVGNDPLIGWMVSKLTGRDAPVARGELVCLVSGPRAGTRWRLLWTLSEDGEKEAEAIGAKIKSKMNTAGALGAVIVGLTTFLLQNSVKTEPDVWQWLALAALATSAGLYFAALFLYDTLQMPSRFWSSRFPSHPRNDSRRHPNLTRLRRGHPSLRRPPTSTARVLQTSMVQVWVWIFTPATVLAGVGVACLALGASGDRHPVGLDPWLVFAAIVVLTAATGAWVAWWRPNLGASD
jgi:MFS family permease